MSEKDQGAVIRDMAALPEGDRQFLLGVMVGMTAKQPKAEPGQDQDQKAG